MKKNCLDSSDEECLNYETKECLKRNLYLCSNNCADLSKIVCDNLNQCTTNLDESLCFNEQ